MMGDELLKLNQWTPDDEQKDETNMEPTKEEAVCGDCLSSMRAR